MIQAQFNRKTFMEKIAGLSDEVAATISLGIFGKECFDIAVAAEPQAPERATRNPGRRTVHLFPHVGGERKPQTERKPRAAKEPSEQDRADDDLVYRYVAQHNGDRAATINPPGLDKKAKGAALKRLVAAGRLRLQGKAGAARYYLTNGAGQEAEA